VKQQIQDHNNLLPKSFLEAHTSLRSFKKSDRQLTSDAI